MNKQNKKQLVKRIKSGVPNFKIDYWLTREFGLGVFEAMEMRKKAEDYVRMKIEEKHAKNKEQTKDVSSPVGSERG